MRIFDIALVLVRTSAAIELIHAAVAVVYTAIRFSFLIGGAEGSPWLNRVEFATWLSPVETAAIGMILLAGAKPIARFAARFAAHTDSASHF